ncbi:MAG: ChbG/HpnK family deacetylase [Terriglobia bacterium]
MKRLIVNADDFGWTEKINQGIVEGHQNGIITSTTLMANGPAFAHAVGLAKSASGLGVGIHLNLSDGTPISNPSGLGVLVNDKGAFHLPPPALLRKLALRKIQIKQVEVELRAQIEKVLQSGLEVTHLDGHKHFHFLPQFLRLVLDLAREYRIPAIRFAREEVSGIIRLARKNWRTSPAVAKQFLVGRTLSWLRQAMAPTLQGKKIRTPDYLIGITSTGYLDTGHLKYLLARLPAGTCELVCHPGYVDPHLLQSPTRLLKQRETELFALLDPAVKEWVDRHDIQLITYKELSGGIS